jgi:hypothetical protein
MSKRKVARVIFAADFKRNHMINVDCIPVDHKVHLFLTDETMTTLRVMQLADHLVPFSRLLSSKI